MPTERVLNHIREIYGMTSSPFPKESATAKRMYRAMLKKNGLKLSDFTGGELHTIPEPEPIPEPVHHYEEGVDITDEDWKEYFAKNPKRRPKFWSSVFHHYTKF